MNTIGVAMIVGGMSLLFSGLIFLLPTERKLSSSNESIEASRKKIVYFLARILKHRSQPVNPTPSEEK